MEPKLKPSDELLKIERRKRPVPRGQTVSLEPSPELRDMVERKGWKLTPVVFSRDKPACSQNRRA